MLLKMEKGEKRPREVFCLKDFDLKEGSEVICRDRDGIETRARIGHITLNGNKPVFVRFERPLKWGKVEVVGVGVDVEVPMRLV